MSDSLPVEGGCARGAIRYSSSAPPLFTFECRCRDCQRATGGPFAVNVFFETPAITFTPEPKDHVVEAAAGHRVRHSFCPECGSPLGMQSDAFADIRGVRAASLDDASGLEPVANLWVQNTYPWEHSDPSLLGSDTQPDAEHFDEFVQRAFNQRAGK